jgi:serine/threonine-protein kinase RsbW
VVLRTVDAACKLIVGGSQKRGTQCSDLPLHVLTAVSEAYNNIVLHGYAGREPGSVQLTIERCPERMWVVLKDTGVSFDPSQALPPDFAALPESGLGIFVMRSMVDEFSYVAGSPNVLTLVKRLDGPAETHVEAVVD